MAGKTGKAGTPASADRDDPAERLLAEAPVEEALAAADPAKDAVADPGTSAGNPPPRRILVLEGGSGSLLDSLAKRLAGIQAEILFHNSDWLHHAAALAHLRTRTPDKAVALRCVLGDLPCAVSTDGTGRPGAEAAWPGALEFPAGSFDAIFYRLGKGTAALHAAVREAWWLLRPGGSLFFAGHTREGIKSLAKRVEDHFGNAELLSLKSSCRLLRCERTGSSPARPIPDPGYYDAVHLTLEVPGLGPVPYISKPGIFSYRATDPGTALLARFLAPMSGMRVLDLGCGSGVLSLAALKLGARAVTAADSNAVAVAAARRNLSGAEVPVKVQCTNLTDDVEGEFDLILSNPPFHQGADTDYGLPGRILDAVLPHLAPGGTMLMVANQFLDYPAQASGRFSACETLAHEQGYRVFRLSR